MRQSLACLAVATLLVAACGSDDESSDVEVAEADDGDAPDGTTEEAVDEPLDEADRDQDGDDEGELVDDGGSIEVDSLDDVPEECRQLMGEFLRDIEPVVSDVDFENATMGDLEQFGEAIDEINVEFEAQSAASGCDDIDFAGGDDASFAAIIELARSEAPGTVGYLEFIADLSGRFDDIGDDSAGDLEIAGGFEDCASAQAYVEGLAADGGTVQDLTMEETLQLSEAFLTIGTACTLEEATEFSQRDDIAAFLGG